MVKQVLLSNGDRQLRYTEAEWLLVVLGAEAQSVAVTSATDRQRVVTMALLGDGEPGSRSQNSLRLKFRKSKTDDCCRTSRNVGSAMLKVAALACSATLL